jgi:hypothetical protein
MSVRCILLLVDSKEIECKLDRLIDLPIADGLLELHQWQRQASLLDIVPFFVSPYLRFFSLLAVQ